MQHVRTDCYEYLCMDLVEAECDPGCAKNGGTCKASFTCLCPAGLSGPSCQTGIRVLSNKENKVYTVEKFWNIFVRLIDPC